MELKTTKQELGKVQVFKLVPKFNKADYIRIMEYYKGKTAQRSGRDYMWHVTEGLLVLGWLNKFHSRYTTLSEEDMAPILEGFCLHALLQSDGELAANYKKVLFQGYYVESEPLAVLYAMEYRALANAYLNKHSLKKVDEINTGVLREVQMMLIADKIQNYKDLVFYNTNHPDFLHLRNYFESWLKALDILDYVEEIWASVENAIENHELVRHAPAQYEARVTGALIVRDQIVQRQSVLNMDI